MICPVCGVTSLVRETRDLPYSYRNESTSIPVVGGDFCPACGDAFWMPANRPVSAPQCWLSKSKLTRPTDRSAYYPHNTTPSSLGTTRSGRTIITPARNGCTSSARPWLASSTASTVPLAVVVLADRVEHVAASGSAGRRHYVQTPGC